MPARPPKVCRVPPSFSPRRVDLRHGPGHQQSLGVVLIAHAVADAAAQGDDVFQRRRQLHADDVVAGIDPEIVVHKGVLHKAGRRPIRAGGHAAGGHGGRPLPLRGKGRKGQPLYRYSRSPPAESGSCAGWCPARCPWTRRPAPSPAAGTAPPCRPVSRTAKDGAAHTTSSAPSRQRRSPVIVSASGRRTPCSRGFSRVLRHLRRLVGVVGPERHVVAVVAEHHGSGPCPSRRCPIPLFSCCISLLFLTDGS